MVFVGEDGTLWHANYDAAAFTGFTFDEVASLDELVAGIGVAGSATPTWAIAGLSLLGVGGAAAASNHNGGSSGSSAPGDTTPPATAIDLLVSPDGLRLAGRGEAGSLVSIRDAAGNLLGTATVGADGSFDVTLNPPQANGENLQVTLTDGAGNTSQPGTVTAPDTTAPDAPVELAISQQGTTLSGRGEAGATVQVRDGNGTLLATGNVAADGTFQLTLDPAVRDGSTLQVTLTDAAGNVSQPGTATSQDLLAPEQPVELLLTDGVTLTGRGEAGSTVQVRDAAGTVIGTAQVGEDGLFSVTLSPAQANGEALDIRLLDGAGNSSTPLQFGAPDITAPVAPSELAVSADGSVVTGRAEPGSTVRILTADGTELGSAVVGATGTFNINLTPPLIDGEQLQVTATDAAGNASQAGNVTAPDLGSGGDTTPPDVPTDLLIGLAGSQLSGRGEAGASVQVRDADGNLLATGTVGADGNFQLALDPAVRDGSTLQVTLTDAAGNISEPGFVTSADLLAPEQPTELALADGVTLTGRGEAGATVQVRDTAGTVIGTALVGADGLFSVTLAPAQANGEALDIRLLDGAGNSSTPLQFDAPDITPPAAVSNIVVGTEGLALSGRGEAGASVQVRDADGNLIGSGTVTANGTFLIDLDPAAQPGESLSLVQTDPSGNASETLQFEVPLTQAPASPSELVVAEDGASLSGNAPPGSRVEVRDANGTLIGSIVAGADGTFTLPLSPAQANGELLDVVAIDGSGASSLPAQITAPDITAPAAPGELAVSADGSVVTGRAEAGSTVRILAADGTELGSAVVGATGTFNITLTPPLIDGEQLQVTATDAAGNASEAGNVTAPDLGSGGDTTPPEVPTDLVIGLAGSQLSGRGEAGASVQVRDANGNVLATGTIAVDGTFQLTLDPAVRDGSTLQVTLTDAAGNVSQPGSVATPDLLAPEQPTELALADGITLTGRGEAGARVQVRDAAGTVIGTAQIGADGQFSVTLSPAQANGEALDIRLVDGVGNSSTPLQFDAPDITPPAAVSNIVVGTGGLALSGRGEAGAIVEVRDANGNLIGTGTVTANGTFLIDLAPAAQPGERLNLVQTDPSGNASEAVQFDVPLTPAPASPSDLVVAEDGTIISGNAPAGSRVEVRDANGTLVGSVAVGADGTFTLPLIPAQANGEMLDVVAIDGSGASSLPVQISAPDITAPANPDELAVSADGSVVTGRAEVGSTVRVLAADGTELGSIVVGATGTFNITLTPPLVDGEQLQVTATDAAGNASAAGNVTAPDLGSGGDTTPPEVPTDLVIGLAGSQLSGRGEAGASVQVRDADGNLLATGTVDPDGTFQLALDPAVRDGSTLQVTLTDAAGNVSEPGSVTSADLLAPEQPTELALADGVTLTGRGEAGATVQVRDAAGTVIGTALVGADGLFSVTLAPAQANGEALDIRLLDGAGNSSTPLQFDAPDITPPAAVSNIVVGTEGLALSGRGEAGASVQVRDADGNLIGSGTVTANGTFLIDLDPAAQPGESLSLVQTDPSGNASEALQFEVPLTQAPASPSELVVAEDGASLSGNAPPGSRVEVRDANGTLIGSIVAGADGTFTLPLSPAQANGELLDVVAIDGSGASSLPAQITAPDITAPAAPGELAVSADGSVVTGRAEAGSTVRILAADGTELGSAVVGATGTFNITLTPPLIDGEQLQVTATDAAGNASEAGNVTAPDLGSGGDTTPPEVPTDLVIGLAGSQLSGRGEAGASVQVRDANGNVLATGTIAVDGTFQLTLDPAVRDGSTLQVTLTDAAGNVSQPGSVATPDLLAPEQPTELALADGITLTGRGEAGARVQVRDAAGTVIGTAQIGADGQFSVTLSPAQANGEALDIRLVDGAGNSSTPLQFDAPDITPPDAVSNIVVGTGGLALSGRGEAGAIVEVRDANGNLIGTGTVTANGTFLIDLAPAAQTGERLNLVQTDPSGNASEAVQFDVPLTPAPASPSDLVVAEDGTIISGNAPAGSRVEVRDANGTLVGSVAVGADGTFTLPLIPAQANGEMLDVVAIDGSGASSLPVQISAPDITAPANPDELAVSADGSVVTGRAEVGSTVRVLAADGTELGSIVVGATGTFNITLTPPLVDGEQLQVTATDAAGNASAAGNVTTPDLGSGGDTTPPEVPTDLVIGLAGSQLSGRGEAGASVQVRDADGNLLATGTVDPDGTFQLALDPAVRDGSTLQVTLTDAAGNVSEPGSVTSADLLAPEQPTELALADGVTLTGRGEAGATVQVRDAAGTVIGTALVGEDGLFSVTLSPAQANGEALDIRLLDGAGNSSTPLQFNAPDITPPAAVSDIVVGQGGQALAGRGEAGATVEVRDADGNLLGRSVVTANGTFLITLEPAAQPGEQLGLIQVDPSGNASPVVAFEVPLTSPPSSPSDLVFAADGTSISGTAPVGSRVEVRDANGSLIGSVVAGADGTFLVALNPAQANGELLDLVAVDSAGASSLPVQLTAPDITAPVTPAELAVSADGSVVTGRAEPGSTVRILAANGTELGSAEVGATGTFNITLTPPLVDGEQLQVTATDAAGNASAAGNVSAPDLGGGGDTTPPEVPTDLVIGLVGSPLSGRGEAGASVQVRDANGNVLATGTVAVDGTFQLTLDPAVRDGSTLQVTLTDAAGNVSQPGAVASPDLLAPEQPTELLLANGVTLTGRGEAGATVQVRDAAGTVIGTALVGADGLFSVTLSPAQANGEALDIRLVDAVGNSSTPLQFDAPDITPPAAVSNILVGTGGLALSGRGEAGASVQVRDADGTLIGTGTVTANGTFLIDLAPAAQPGESLSLVQTDPSGNASEALQFDVPLIPAPVSPSELVVAEDGASISGSAPAGSRVEVRDANGTLIGSVAVGADGSFTLPLIPAQANGELLDVVAIDGSGVSSIPAQVSAPDITPPVAPTELAVSADGSVVTGRAEAGSTVRILAADGTELGNALVGPTGVFSVTLTPPQVDGEQLQVSATDTAGNASTASTVTAPDLDNGGDTTPPDAPTDLVIGLAGTELSGRGEAGASVQVRDAAGNVLANGTVQADGTLRIALDPPVLDGSTLQVVLTDAAGNVSQPGSVTAQDLLAPEQPTELALADGVTLTGRGEAGATVQVRDAAGTVIGTALVGADGLFSVTLLPAQANGEALDIRLVDGAGNSSTPLQFDAPDITPPAAVSNIAVASGGLTLSGRGEAGASVQVRDADGNLIGTGTVTANGTFLIDLNPAAQPGARLSLVQTDPSGNASEALQFEVPLIPAPASPSDLVVAEDGTSISGNAPAGSRVEVRDANGSLVGSVAVGADGSFTLPLIPVQANGELLDVVAIDASGVSSIPAQISAPDITPPVAPTELAVSADGSMVTGRAEAGSTVRILAADGTELGNALVGPTGTFNITLTPPLIDGEQLQVTATDAAGNASEAGNVTAPDLGSGGDTTPPDVPTDLVIGLAGSQLSGRGEAGASVQVRDADGNLLATGTVDPDGNFQLALDPAVRDGSTLQVTLTDAAGNVSEPGSVTSADLLAPEQPTELALADGVTLSGRGEVGATVQVRDAAGTVVGTAQVGADGLFSVTLSPAQANGEALEIRLVDGAGNSSTPLQFDAPDITPPASVSSIVVGTGGLALSGRGEAGASVQVRDADGNLIGAGTVTANGTFLIDLTPAAQPGQSLSLVQTDPSGNASETLQFDVPLTPAPASPSDLVVAEDGTSISGSAPAGSRVEVRDANGTLIGTVAVSTDGSFSVPLSPAQANGELLDVVAVDASGASSLPVQLTAPDITAPAIPDELAVSADGSAITGRAEPGSTVRILAADGSELGNALVGPTGTFTITLAPPQVDGEQLQVTASDAAGNTSAAGSVTAPDIDSGDTTPPAAPDALLIGLAGSQLSGRGEAGASVQVRDADGNVLATGTVGPDGDFQLTLVPAVNDGSTLQVVLTDAAGNVSEPGSVTSADLLAPEQPTELALADGVTLTGRGEAGATVQVRDAAGTVIGTAQVGADGLFSVTLSPTQANGEALDIRLVDAAGNSSTPLQFDAPDSTPPAAVSNIVVATEGLAVSGRGEAGANVEVRNASGTLIGSGTVTANGTFLIDLDPAAQPGARLSLVQTDPSGNASEALQFDVPLAPVPASPSDLLVAEDGTSVSGTAAVGSRVEVRDASGALLGTVVVGAEGSFSLALNPVQANGELLDVIALDASGTSSLPVQVSAPDITAPSTPAELAINADGSIVSGRAEPGSTVRVLAADGSELGSAVVGATGTFNIPLTPPQVDGESLQVTAADAAGNTSIAGSLSAPDIDLPGGDITPPEPASDLAISNDGRLVSGRGEPGATVRVLNDQGQELTTGTVLPDGSFSVLLPTPVVDGSALQVTLTDAAGNVSTASPLTAPDHVAPAQPTGLTLSAGETLVGSAEAGARVEVRDATGALIGSGIVTSDGSFTLTLNPAQANGESLAISVIDATGNTSVPLSYTAPDITAPALITDVLVGGGSLTVSGRGEAGATVQVRDASGNVLGSGTVAANGTFLVDLDNPVGAGDILVLVQTDAAGNTSTGVSIIVADAPLPESPAELVLAADGTSISGSAPAGSQVQVRDAQGNLLGSAQAGVDGAFSINLSPAQANGELLDVVAIDGDGNSSLPTQITAHDITAPSEARDLQLSADGSTLSGRGEAGASVQVSNAQGTVLGSAVVGANGVFSVTLTPAQTDGQVLDIALRDAAGNTSSASLTAPDLDGPLQPADLAIDVGGTHLTGLGQAGSTVTVRDADGAVLGSAAVGADGRFDVTLGQPQRNGESLTVEATDGAGNSAGPVTFTAPDTTPPQTVTSPAIDDSGSTVTGSGEPGANVTVRAADGSVLGTAVVADDGSFEVILDTPQTNGQALTLEQRDATGNVSQTVALPAPDSQAPSVPTDLTLSADGAVLNGTGEPGALVSVTGTGGAVLGSTVVAADGSFRVAIDPPQLNGQSLSITQADAAGNTSGAGALVATDIQAPEPAQGLGLGAGGTLLTGQGEAGSTVEVRNAAGELLGDAVVDDNGDFSVTLSPAQTNGEVLSVVLTDSAGNASPSAPFTTTDTSAPTAPAGLQISADGASVRGTGEAGATVEVRNAEGSLLGSVTVPADGNFSVALVPAQLDGQPLDVTLTDTAGNTSDATAITAPDLTPPALPTDVTVSDDGTSVTGNAPGATSVTVIDPAGTELTVPVNADGSFSVPLDTPLTNGETLSVVVTDGQGNSSVPATVTAPDSTAPDPATAVTISPDGSSVGGSAEPGSTVIIRNPDDTERGSATAGPDGTFVVPVDPPLASGDNVELVVRDAAGNESSIGLTGPVGNEATTPSELAISADGFLLTGQGTVGSLITVTSAGTTLGTATVGSDGMFRVFFNNAQLNAQVLQVTARVGVDGQPSVPATLVANDSTAPDAPTQLAIDRSGSTLTGRGEVGATVSVVNAQGTILGSATVGDNGLFSVTLVPAQANGQNLTISQADAKGNASLAATLQAFDLQAPDQATGLSLNNAATVVSGQGEAGASVSVRDASGALLATGTVNQSGQFQVTLPGAQTTGAPLQVTLTDAAGNASGPASLVTPDRTPPAAITDPLLSADGRQLSGSGEVGAQVQVRNAAGSVLGTATVGADGRFTVVFDTPQASGQAIGVTQLDAAGNTSPAVTVSTPDLTPPAALANVVLNNNGLTLTGLGEAGATVTVRSPDGTILGSGLVAANGGFSLTLDTAQLNAQRLSVTQTDTGNNTSTAVTLTAPDLTPPAAPTALSLARSGLLLSGSAEPGSTVSVRDASGAVLGTAQAASNGTFQVTLDSAQTNGQVLQVTATDAAGNVSPAAPYTAADTTPPAAVGNLAVAADGLTLSGTGEAGATVTVRATDGSSLGTASVAADGRFTVTLAPAAAAGDSLSVTQADAAQNASEAQTITAPGVLAPDIPGNLVLAADGLSVIGTGTPGSTVNVYGPNGVLLGTAPVANDGTFTVNLGSAQTNGEVLHISALGSDGSPSLPATLQAPDTTAPQPLSSLVLAADGLVLTGHGEPGATVNVLGEGGVDLGQGTVDANGNFSIALSTAQINGEQLSASQADGAGNESNSVSLTAPDQVAPEAAQNLAFAGGGSLLNGTGEAASSVRVIAADGSVLGTAVVRGDGTFQVNLNAPQANGQQVQVVLTDAAGNQSAASAINAPDTTPPTAPSELAISSDGITLTGRGEAGALISVANRDGDEIGTALVDASGHFSVTLDPALGNAELLSLTQTDAAGNVSAVATLQTPDFTPPAVLTEVVINADGSVVSGRGEVGATVTVTNAAGVLLGTTSVLADGSFRVELTTPQINQQVLAVQQADPPGNISAPVSIEAPDLTPPAAATELRLNASGEQLGGVGEAGASVRVYLGSTQIGSATVAANGTFVVDLNAAQLNGQLLQVTLTDPRGNVSPISTVTAVDTTPPLDVIATINDSGTQLIGSGEAGARVTVVNDQGNLVGQGVIGSDGIFVLNLSTPQINGQALTLIAQDATGNPSAPLLVTAPDLTPPAQPTGLQLDATGTLLSGTAEPGSSITVRGPDNAVIGTLEVPANGQFIVTLSPAQNNGQLLTVVSTDDAGNTSLPATYQAADTLPPPPVTDLAINDTYTLLTGRGEAGARVTVSFAGNVIGTGEVGAGGTFQITLETSPGGAATLTVTQTDSALNTSAVASYLTPLIPPPVPPTNVLLAADGLTLTGTAPAGASIRVYDAAGNQIGSGVANIINGGFSLQLDTPQLNGQTLSVTSLALLGGESQPVFLQAADITPPANPVVTALSANGLVLTGLGEAGATVTVRDANNAVLGTGLVNAGGVFSINLNGAQLNGQVLSLTQADAAQNVSASTLFTATDVQAPVAPSNLAIDAAGTQLSGVGEAGATVTVLGPNGQVGTAVVQANGTFSITLSTPQNDGQQLVVRQADAAGNQSGSASITAPDTTAPTAPAAAINANGTAVSGSGQPGTTVSVRNSAGTLLGSATVGSNGLFVVSLTAAQVDNQALSVTLTDAAQNTSTGTALTAPDLTPPAAAGNLLVSADGSTLTGTGEVGATVTVRSANGTVLQTATVQADGTFSVTLSPVQDNGQVLSVTLTDPRNNVSGNVNITAPDVDANAPVVASDNLATATVNLAPVVSNRTFQDSFTTLLAGFSKTFTWTVGAGTSVDPTLTLTTSSALALLDNASFTLQVKNASGAWVTLASGTSQGLLDLILLPLGQGIRVDIGDLLAGDYRLTVASGGIGLLTTVTTTLDVETTSLTQFTGTGTPTSGNVITDPGIDGSIDARGPDSAAVLQVLKNGSYVTAGGATEVQGQYGTLVIRADGSYTYTPNASPASIGKVDVFSYQLLHANGVSDTANLYVRIDSPQATEIWSSTNYSAPATVVDAVNDIDSSNITLAHREASSSTTFTPLSLPLIGSRSATYTTTVATDTTADLQVVLNSTNLLGLLNGATVDLLKLNPATGQYVLVQSVAGGSLVSLLGGGAAHTFQAQGPGSYHIRVSAGGIGLLSSITTSLNTKTTFNNEFVVGSYTPVTGNLLTDTAGGGADNLGSPLTVLSVLVAANTYAIPGYNGVSVTGTYGTLLVHADGSYSYALKAGLSSAVIGNHDTFTYELTHPNGTTDTANLVINLDNAAGFTATSSLLADNGDDGVGLASVAAAASSEVIAGTDGNDHLDGSQGGAVSLLGGAGDDTLVVVDQHFASVEGGTGSDTLLWGGGDASIDLGNLVGRVHDIEVIDLNATSAVSLTLNLADVVAISETGNDTLLIKGDSNDSVHMTDNWTLAGNQSADGVAYTQYTAQEDPSHHLWVQNGIHVV
ncbi:BapA/Bap/LapF family large adhesin [Pseudomonas putida]